MNRLIILSAVAMLIAGLEKTGASAQRDGTVTIVGYVAPSLNVQLVETKPIGGISAAAFANDGRLTLIMDLDGGAPPSGKSPVGAMVTFALRGNTDYQLSASADASGITGITPRNVGFGVGNVRASGSDIVPGAINGALIAPKFASDPFSGRGATLVDILGRKIKLMNGTRISRRGNWNTPGNALLVDTYYAIMPQLFTPPVVINITYTISVP